MGAAALRHSLSPLEAENAFLAASSLPPFQSPSASGDFALFGVSHLISSPHPTGGQRD